MKSFIVGLLTIIALGLVGYYTFKATTSLISKRNPSPSPSPSSSVSPSTTPQPKADPPRADKPSTTPEPSLAPTTKGGLPLKSGSVKGVSTTKTTTTSTTTSHLTLTLVKTSTCPISYMTEIKDIQGPLTFRYSLNDGGSFGITIWKADGNEALSNTTYSGNSGQITTISGVNYLKVRVESKTCASNNDNWLTLTAER